MSQISLPFLQTSQRVLEHYRQTGECLACYSPIKHEIHLYNHWKKHHVNKNIVAPASVRVAQTKDIVKPKYWVWFQNTWVQVDMHIALAAMIYKRCVAVEKESHTRANA